MTDRTLEAYDAIVAACANLPRRHRDDAAQDLMATALAHNHVDDFARCAAYARAAARNWMRTHDRRQGLASTLRLDALYDDEDQPLELVDQHTEESSQMVTEGEALAAILMESYPHLSARATEDPQINPNTKPYRAHMVRRSRSRAELRDLAARALKGMRA